MLLHYACGKKKNQNCFPFQNLFIKGKHQFNQLLSNYQDITFLLFSLPLKPKPESLLYDIYAHCMSIVAISTNC